MDIICLQCPWRPEEGGGSLGLESPIGGEQLCGTGWNSTWVLQRSSQYSQPLIHPFSPCFLTFLTTPRTSILL